MANLCLLTFPAAWSADVLVGVAFVIMDFWKTLNIKSQSWKVDRHWRLGTKVTVWTASRLLYIEGDQSLILCYE